MVDDPAGYIGSSYQAHVLGKRVSLHTPHEEYLKLGGNYESRAACYRGLFSAYVDGHLISEVRSTANKGLAFGSDRFMDEIERLHGRRVRQARMGRPEIGMP